MVTVFCYFLGVEFISNSKNWSSWSSPISIRTKKINTFLSLRKEPFYYGSRYIAFHIVFVNFLLYFIHTSLCLNVKKHLFLYFFHFTSKLFLPAISPNHRPPFHIKFYELYNICPISHTPSPVYSPICLSFYNCLSLPIITYKRT